MSDEQQTEKLYEVHVSSVSDFTAYVRAKSAIDAAHDATQQGIGDWNFEQTEHIANAVAYIDEVSDERFPEWENPRGLGYCPNCTHCNAL